MVGDLRNGWRNLINLCHHFEGFASFNHSQGNAKPYGWQRDQVLSHRNNYLIVLQKHNKDLILQPHLNITTNVLDICE